MASFKLGIFLLLVAAATVATLGSPVMERQPRIYSEHQERMKLEPNPNDYYEKLEQYQNDYDEKLEPNQNDYDEELEDDVSKRNAAAAGAVIAGAELTVEVIGKVLDALGDIGRKIAIGIDNESGHEWKALNAYFFSGTSDITLPHIVPSGEALLYNARKSSGPVATGTVGVIAYYMKSLDKTLAVMFSVPFDYNLYSNWWDIGCYNGETRASKTIYEWMYYENPYKGDNGWQYKTLCNGLKMRGIMTSNGGTTLEIHVEKE